VRGGFSGGAFAAGRGGLRLDGAPVCDGVSNPPPVQEPCCVLTCVQSLTQPGRPRLAECPSRETALTIVNRVLIVSIMDQPVQGSLWGQGGDGRRTAARTTPDCADTFIALTSQNTLPQHVRALGNTGKMGLRIRRLGVRVPPSAPPEVPGKRVARVRLPGFLAGVLRYPA
jgi:hypothetical protein